MVRCLVTLSYEKPRVVSCDSVGTSERIAGTEMKNLEKQETATSAREVNQEEGDDLDVETHREKAMSERAASHETEGAIETHEKGKKEVREIRAFTSHRQKIVKARKRR